MVSNFLYGEEYRRWMQSCKLILNSNLRMILLAQNGGSKWHVDLYLLHLKENMKGS